LGKQAITQEHYEAVLALFRSDNPAKSPSRPGSDPGAELEKWQQLQPVRISKLSGIDTRTVRKLYEVGIPRLNCPAIKEVLDGDKAKARALIYAQQEADRAQRDAERKAIGEQAAKARSAEAAIVDVTRSTAMQGVQVGLQLIVSANKVAQLTRKRIEDRLAGVLPDGTADPRSPLDYKEGIAMLGDIATIERDLVAYSRAALELERIHLGKPIHRIDVQITDVSQMTRQELDARATTVEMVLEQVRATGTTRPAAPKLLVPAIGVLVKDSTTNRPATLPQNVPAPPKR
jgi:hypothetical protein